MPLTRPQFYQVDSTLTKINDPIIEVNASATGANATDIGIIFKRDGADNLAMLWDRTEQAFVFGKTTATSDTEGSVTFTSLADLQVNSIKTAGFQLPSVDGSDGQVLVTNGTGTVTWQSINGGTYPV